MTTAPATEYVDVWYKPKTAADAPLRTALGGPTEADVCIIGGGLAGLTAAHDLARAGRKVALVEARRVGWGASGRNGGFVGSGYSAGYDRMAARVGKEAANALFAMSIEGIQIVAGNIRDLNITAAAPCPGILGAVRYDAGRGLMDHRDWLAREFDYHVDHLDRAALAMHVTSPRYHQALHDQNAFHFDPLAYCLGLARAAEAAGASIYEATPGNSLERTTSGWVVSTPKGRITARDVLVTTGGYTDRLVPELNRSFLPIATYVMTTKADLDLIATAIHTTSAIGDDRRAGDYYRLVDGGKRVLWGGKITTRTSEPGDLGKLLHRTMTDTYPQLANLQIDQVWTGLMSYARHMMPQIGKLPSGLWYCTAFGGHGMNTTAIGGRVIAEGILGQTDRYRQFAPFGLDWVGGIIGMAAVQLTYWQYQAMDIWRERKG